MMRTSPLLFLQDSVKLLRYMSGTTNLELGKIYSDRLASNQWSRDIYSQRKAPGFAHNVCNLMRNPFQNASGLQVLEFFKSMVSEHDVYFPNEYISSLVLSSCVNSGHLLFGTQCHGYMLKSGLVFNKYMENALVCLHSMLPDVVGAMHVKASNDRLDIRSYNLMLDELVEKGYLDEALSFLKRMSVVDKVWNKATYIGLFGLCCKLSDLDLGREVHNKLLKSNVEFDVSVCSEMIQMYGICGDILTAAKVFDMYEVQNVVIWTAMLAALSLELFSDMQHENVAPNEYTFCVLLDACAKILYLRYGSSLHAFAHKTGFKDHKNVESALIDMYARSGDIKAAEKVFLGTTYRDTLTWNIMIGGYAYHGLGSKSLALFKKMLEKGEEPDSLSFICVLNACEHMGLVEEGYYYLYEFMEQKGVKPGLEHYMCIISILIRAARLREALSFIASTPLKWHACAWVALLNGCQEHQNSSLFNRIEELIPHDLTPKVNNEDPEFDKLDDVMKPMFEAINDDSANLDDIEVSDGMKEDRSDYHSEEVAVAYALRYAPYIAPIRLIKSSGRICDRCHSRMKLISKVRRRLIMVRDQLQFHNFQDGRCSCEDYW
uniref:DYW domain-containing protein n=1 Tax=Lactuca sativa TaxID=4236 RepID=A0A9R1XLJ5_LACSA|nr:hypothetical protein LSAT_V11C300142960 [Lactuca sativa]